jgi:hypothetical protein
MTTMTMTTRNELTAALAKADAETETHYTALTELAEAVRAYLAQDAGTWTVLGIWDNDEAVPIGAIAGTHSVHGEAPGDRLHAQLIGNPDFYGFDTSSFYEQGVWAETVAAPDGDTAQDVAAEKMMRAQHGDDWEPEDGEGEDCQAGTCRHPHEPAKDGE